MKHRLAETCSNCRRWFRIEIVSNHLSLPSSKSHMNPFVCFNSFSVNVNKGTHSRGELAFTRNVAAHGSDAVMAAAETTSAESV